jgi:hypothetical protein|tara:strand:+ start:306 stop:500 length:195 start_codon:yes stop_codon:yes gene_type:complete
MAQSSFHTVDLTEPEVSTIIESLHADVIATENRQLTERDLLDVELMEFYHNRAKVLQMLKGLAQ